MKKTKRICGLEWEEASIENAPSAGLKSGHRILRRICTKYYVNEYQARYAQEWAAEHIMPFGVPNLVTTGKTQSAAVAKLLRLEERVLRELMKGRVE